MLSGVINIYKEEAYTSQDVVAVVRKILGGVKAGHTGTLDPIARGVLPVCLGKATKLADFIQAGDKTYKAMMRLGVETDSEDITGEVIETKPVNVSLKEIELAAEAFLGEYMQTPPMYSAVKVNGKRLYKLARRGEEVERPARQVFIHNIRVNRFIPPDMAEITVDCSKGVYIRTLIADIGRMLGCGACMSALERTRSGAFTADDAVTLGRLRELFDEGRANEVIQPVEAVLPYAKVFTEASADIQARNGNKLSAGQLDEGNIAVGERVFVYDSEKRLCGIYEAATDGRLKAVAMLYGEV